MKVVIALGGNALLKLGEPLEAAVQRVNVARAAAAVATVARKHTVVVTHGNGPQVGLLALQSEAYQDVRPYPLDILGAESEGMIGYLIELELQNRLPGRQVVTLLTQIEVNPGDPAFKKPEKPIGPAYGEEAARQLARKYGWTMAPAGAKWRRVVPSPEPLRIRELGAIRMLMDAGIVVVCAGGGGVPVATAPGGAASGMEAVIDKDLAAALLAHELGADALLMLTDVDAAYSAWGTHFKQPIRETMPEQLRKMPFAPGSMKPKVEAACRFVEGGGSFAGIGLLEDAAAILEGKRGTVVRPTGVSLDFVKRAKSAERAPPPAKSRTPTISRAAPQQPAQKAPRPAPAPPPAAAPRPPSKPRPDAAPEPWVPFHIRSIPAPPAPSPEPTTRSRRKTK